MVDFQQYYKQWKKDKLNSKRADFQQYYNQWRAPRIAEEICNRTNQWLTNTGSLLDEYNTRYTIPKRIAKKEA